MRIAASQGGEGLAFAVAVDHVVLLLGGQASTAAPTPLQTLNRLMSGTPTSDDRRDQGAQAYQRALATPAHRSDGIDAFWDSYASSCVASAVRTGDRAWIAVYEADVVRSEVAVATEAARRLGVYPRVMRDLRREHRMERRRWER